MQVGTLTGGTWLVLTAQPLMQGSALWPHQSAGSASRNPQVEVLEDKATRARGVCKRDALQLHITADGGLGSVLQGGGTGSWAGWGTVQRHLGRNDPKHRTDALHPSLHLRLVDGGAPVDERKDALGGRTRLHQLRELQGVGWGCIMICVQAVGVASGYDLPALPFAVGLPAIAAGTPLSPERLQWPGPLRRTA